MTIILEGKKIGTIQSGRVGGGFMNQYSTVIGYCVRQCKFCKTIITYNFHRGVKLSTWSMNPVGYSGSPGSTGILCFIVV